jgi:biotin synthase-related radical SAM superfamily protein
MKSFSDNAGRTWTIAINVDAIKRVRGLLDVDLLEVVEGKLIEKLIRDPVLLCDVVYAVCKPEADAKGVSDEEFGRAMAGDAIDHATKALLEELVDFSPSPRDRANLGRVLEKTWAVMDRARDVIEARLSDGEIEKAVEQALANVGVSSGAAPASPASSPDG